MIEFKCDDCGQGIQAPESLAGKTKLCPKCGLLNLVPGQPGWETKARQSEGGVAIPTPAAPVAPPSCCAQCGEPFCGSGRVRSIVCTYCGHVTIDDSVECDRIELQVVADAEPVAPATLAEPASPPTIADQVATEWAAIDPAANSICIRCGKSFPVVGAAGVPSILCPYCGFVPGESCCRGMLEALANRLKCTYVVAEMTELARAVAGPEPSVVRTQCRCSHCGAVSESPPAQAGQDEICPECGRKLTAADRLASELIAFNAGATTQCRRCKTSSSVAQFGMTCPHCGDAPSEEICEGGLKHRREKMGDWRKIKRLGELLSADSAGRKTPRFICPFCKFELPSSLAERNFAHVACPRCNHVDVYVYNAEAFDSPRECQRVLEFRLEKRKKAKDKARERELAEAAKEIATEMQPDRGQANGGYVYAMLNSTMPGLVKIGLTEREPDERAKELSAGTGIPTPFIVAFAEWFGDCCAGEDFVHALLEEKGFRVAQNREFFCAPVRAAIQAIMKAKERDDAKGGLRPDTGRANGSEDPRPSI